jgi:hypothetical protein
MHTHSSFFRSRGLRDSLLPGSCDFCFSGVFRRGYYPKFLTQQKALEAAVSGVEIADEVGRP